MFLLRTIAQVKFELQFVIYIENQMYYGSIGFIDRNYIINYIVNCIIMIINHIIDYIILVNVNFNVKY